MVMQVSVLLAVRLYGARGAMFSIMSSASAVMVAASLVAEHSYIPRSPSTNPVIVRLPPLRLNLSAGSGCPSFCKLVGCVSVHRRRNRSYTGKTKEVI